MVKGSNSHSDNRDTVAGAPWAPAVLADKGLFLLLLYDKAISCMDEALQLMEEGDMVGKGERLVRAQDIVLELSDALDKAAGDIAVNLERLYLYIYRRLIRGNVRLDRDAIVEARALMKKLLSGWQTAILGRDSIAVPTDPVSPAATAFSRLRA
jgi:flagellar protein FliS